MTEADAEGVAGFIEAVYERFIAAAMSGDFTQLVNDVYAPDAVVVGPGTTLVGREQIEQHFRRSLVHIADGWIRTDTVVVSGDFAYETGHSRLIIEPPGEAPVSVYGRYLAVWRKLGDDRWIVAAEALMRDP